LASFVDRTVGRAAAFFTTGAVVDSAEAGIAMALAAIIAAAAAQARRAVKPAQRT
jgi:hypothetical protein